MYIVILKVKRKLEAIPLTQIEVKDELEYEQIRPHIQQQLSFDLQGEGINSGNLYIDAEVLVLRVLKQRKGEK